MHAREHARTTHPCGAREHASSIARSRCTTSGICFEARDRLARRPLRAASPPPARRPLPPRCSPLATQRTVQPSGVSAAAFLPPTASAQYTTTKIQQCSKQFVTVSSRFERF
eukprot:11712310-Alexandrium_andersonii.AAC.1